MKHLILLFIIFLSFTTKAQSDVETGEIAKRLVKVLNEHHIRPRELNDDLANRIHENLIEDLDGEKAFFTKEDLVDLEESRSAIVLDLKNELEVYLTKIKKLHSKNLGKIKAVHADYFGSDIDLSKRVETSDVDFTESVGAEHFDLKWKFIFRMALMDRVLSNLEDRDFEISQDSLKQLISESQDRVKEVFEDYFKNLEEEETFIDNMYLNAIANAYDPHSNYFSFSQNKAYKEELSSERELFGVSYIKNGKGEIEVSHIVPGSSAWLSGEVRVGDIIRKIKFGDEETIDLKGKSRYQLHKLFDEDESDRVVLTLENENDGIKTVELFKTKVYSDDDIIKSAVLNGEKKVGYISLPDFYSNWNDDSGLGCANDLAKTLIKLKRDNIEGVILDLRDNGGGSLKEAIDLAGIFVDFGPILVATGTELEKPFTYKDFNRGAIYTGPLIVMVNENSASASEVVAGALQDYNRAVIVGQRSFGKATGQSIYPVAPGYLSPFGEKAGQFGYVKITKAALYRIDLSTNQFNGVVPDIDLEIPYEYDPFREKDYRNVIQLDSIYKKMYFTPKPEIELNSIASRSKVRQMSDSAFILSKSFIKRYEDLYDSKDEDYLNLDEAIEFRKAELALDQELENLLDDVDSGFTTESTKYDEDVYKMSKYLNLYREAFHEEIESDRELKETYQIMLELINN